MARAVSRKVFYLTALIFVPLALILNLLVFRLYHVDKAGRLNSLAALETQHLESRCESIEKKLTVVRSDIRFLSDLDEVRQFLLFGEESHRQVVESIFLHFARNRGIYDQVRLLGSDGMELVRIDSRPEGAHVVPQEELQDKHRRYYFSEAMALGPDTVYMSPFDLNIEHGEIERPFIPMIRFSLKVVDGAGEPLGLVLLNYYGRDLLPDRVDNEAMTGNHLILLNEEGYFLFGPSPEDEWGFMFPDGRDRTLAVRDPQAWESLLKEGEEGQFHTAQGQYSFFSIHPLDILENSEGEEVEAPREWILASFIPSGSPLLHFGQLALSHFILALGLTGLLLVVVFLIVRAMERERTRALVDPLTTLWNRRSFMERIDRLQSRLSDGGEASIGLIDLGNFKNVNDWCGHHAGDEALVLASQALLEGVRVSDFVGRYGGDEFVVCFPGLSLEQAEAAMGRLAGKVNGVVIPSCRKAQIIADWGVAHFPSEAQTLRKALEMADARMYEHKRRRKLAQDIPLEREVFEEQRAQEGRPH